MIFHTTKRELLNQINIFVEYKAQHKGTLTAIRHKEWLAKFHYLTEKDSVYSLSLDDVILFKEKMLNSYASDYVIAQSIHSLYCLLKFYKRYDVIRKATCEMKHAYSIVQ